MESNRVIELLEKKRLWDIHEKNLKAVRSQVDTGRSQSIKKGKAPKKQSITRRMEIQLENRALLSKLTKKTKQQTPQILKLKKMKKNDASSSDRDKQNSLLLKRIKAAKSNYNHQKFVEDYKEREKYVNNLCKYSYKDKKPTKTITRVQMINDISKYFSNKAVQSLDKSFNHIKTTGSEVKTKHRLSSPTQIKHPEKIVRFFHNVHKESQSVRFVIKGVLYENQLVLQIELEDNIHRLALSVQTFETNFSKSYTKLCKKVHFDKQNQYFYIK